PGPPRRSLTGNEAGAVHSDHGTRCLCATAYRHFGTAIDPALLLQQWCRMTAQTTQNLDRTLVHGIAWTGAIRWATQSLSWAATFILPRLLTPPDYGLVGMAMIYVGLAQIVSEGGVAAAVVQQRDLTEQQIAELNGLAAMIGVVLFVLTLVLAAPIAWF